MNTIIYQGKEYTLKPKNIKIVRLEDNLYRATTLEEAYKRQFEYIKTCLGDDFTLEHFNTTDYLEVENFDEVTYVVNEIDLAYKKKVLDQTTKMSKKTVSNYKDVVALARQANALKNK